MLEGSEGVRGGDLAPGGVAGVSAAAEGGGGTAVEGVADVLVAIDALAGRATKSMPGWMRRLSKWAAGMSGSGVPGGNGLPAAA